MLRTEQSYKQSLLQAQYHKFKSTPMHWVWLSSVTEASDTTECELSGS